MTPNQSVLIQKARESLSAARLLQGRSYYEFAAARAYYAMFYVAEACLLSRGLSFSSHSAVIAAFGQHFAKTNVLPPDLHRALIRGMEVRQLGDYDSPGRVTEEECAEQITRADRFIQIGEDYLNRLGNEEGKSSA